MLKMFFFYMLILFSIIMIFLNHPLSLGLMILIQTFILCLLSGMMIYSYWFSYILFLTFLGGLLILFIYTSSIASNEIFKFHLNFKLFFFISYFSIFFISFLFFNNLFFFNNMFNLEMMNSFNMFLFLNNLENNINLSKLYNEQTYFLMFMLIIYLFITLIVVVKITNIFFGPLRSFN